MISELYDKTIIVLSLAVALCTVILHPVFGDAVAMTYLVAAYSFFLTPLLERRYNNGFIRLIYTGSFVVAGFTAILTPLLLIGIIVNTVAYQYTAISYASIIIRTVTYASLVLSAYAIIKSYHISERQETIDLGGEDELVIAHISDVHLGATIGEQRLDRVISKVKSINPDYTVITGDTFDGSGWPQASILEPLERLDNVYASLGNHDYYYGDPVKTMLEQNGVTVLSNDTADEDDVRFVGVDDIEYEDQVPSEHIVALAPKTPDKPNILLYHRPEEIEAFTANNYDVMLSGHTHNGQIYSLTILASFVYHYMHGLYSFGDKALNVSSGVGTGGPPMRLGTTNEICTITITH